LNLISGITFIKNGLTLGYPFKESIESIEPLCDEVIINVGFDDPTLVSDDGTYEFLRDTFTHKKFIFLKSWWDPNLRSGGEVLSLQTNLALAKATGKYCQYIQGDEVLHEDDLPAIHNGVIKLENERDIDGLIFNYRHFYGDVSIYKYSRNIYRREVRLIRNGAKIKSWKDAQGFRFSNDLKISAKGVDAKVYHYGWARAENVMRKKVKSFSKLYHQDSYVDKVPEFVYEKGWGMKQFLGTHPQVMNAWIEANKNSIDFSSMKLKWEWNMPGLWISDLLESLTNYRIGEYKNFKYKGEI